MQYNHSLFTPHILRRADFERIDVVYHLFWVFVLVMFRMEVVIAFVGMRRGHRAGSRCRWRHLDGIDGMSRRQ